MCGMPVGARGSAQDAHGVFSRCLEWAWGVCGGLKALMGYFRVYMGCLRYIWDVMAVPRGCLERCPGCT